MQGHSEEGEGEPTFVADSPRQQEVGFASVCNLDNLETQQMVLLLIFVF